MNSHEAAEPRAPRSRFYDGSIYARRLDPFNAELRGFIADQVEPGAKVLDVGCGTGALAFQLAQKAAEVVGVDLSPAMVAYATRRLAGAARDNLSFLLGDAGSVLADRGDGWFDVATMVLVLHELPAEARPRVLREATRVARRLICVDFRVPLPWNLRGLLHRGLEAAAGVEHLRAFRDFNERGGTPGLAASAALGCRHLSTVGGGTLDVSEVRR